MFGRIRKGAAMLLGKPVHIGQYTLKLVRVIGEGGFGFVYEAADEGRSYAVKKLICQTQEQVGVARHEFEVMRQLGFCRACAPLLDMSETTEGGNTVIYGVMPLYSCSVNDLVAKGKLPEPFLLGVLARVIEALHALHSLGMVHLDVKSTNFFLSLPHEVMENVSMLTAEHAATCVLGDYGSCTQLCIPAGMLRTNSQLRERIRGELTAKTTQNFRSPEIVDIYRGMAIGPVSDTFSLGVTLFQMAYNKLAFETDGAASNCKYKIPFEFDEIYNRENAAKPYIEKGGVQLAMGGRDPYVIEAELRDRGIPFDERRGKPYSANVVHLIQRMLVRNNNPSAAGECRASLVELADYLNSIGVRCNLDKSLVVDEFALNGTNSSTPATAAQDTPKLQNRPQQMQTQAQAGAVATSASTSTAAVSAPAANIFDILGSPSTGGADTAQQTAPSKERAVASPVFGTQQNYESTSGNKMCFAPQNADHSLEPGSVQNKSHGRTHSGAFSIDDWMSDLKVPLNQTTRQPGTTMTTVGAGRSSPMTVEAAAASTSAFDMFKYKPTDPSASTAAKVGAAASSQQDVFSQFEFATADSATLGSATAGAAGTEQGYGRQPGQPLNIFSDFAVFTPQNTFTNVPQEMDLSATQTSKQLPFLAEGSMSDVEGDGFAQTMGIDTGVGNLIDLDFSGTGPSTAEPTEDIIQNLEKTKHNMKIKQAQSESDSLADNSGTREKTLQKHTSDDTEESTRGKDGEAIGKQKPASADGLPALGVQADADIESGAQGMAFGIPSAVSESKQSPSPLAGKELSADTLYEHILASSPSSVNIAQLAPLVYSPHAEEIINGLVARTSESVSLAPDTVSSLLQVILLLLTDRTGISTLKCVAQFLAGPGRGASPRVHTTVKETLQLLQQSQDAAVTDLKVLGGTARQIKALMDPLYSVAGVLPASLKNVSELHAVDFLFDLARSVQERSKDPHMLFSAAGRLDVEYSRFRTVVSRAHSSHPDAAELARVGELPVTRLEKAVHG